MQRRATLAPELLPWALTHGLEPMAKPMVWLWELRRIFRAGSIAVPLPLPPTLLAIDADPYGRQWWIGPGPRSRLEFNLIDPNPNL